MTAVISHRQVIHINYKLKIPIIKLEAANFFVPPVLFSMFTGFLSFSFEINYASRHHVAISVGLHMHGMHPS